VTRQWANATGLRALLQVRGDRSKRKLIKNPTPDPLDPNTKFIFNGDEMVVDEATQVFTMLDTPKRQTMWTWARQRALSKNDASTSYTRNSFIGLEACFNGQPELMETLAHGTMPDLASAADALSKRNSKAARPVRGPTFEWTQ